jgi:hypothetical protein
LGKIAVVGEKLSLLGENKFWGKVAEFLGISLNGKIFQTTPV